MFCIRVPATQTNNSSNMASQLTSFNALAEQFRASLADTRQKNEVLVIRGWLGVDGYWVLVTQD